MWIKVNCQTWKNSTENLELSIFFHTDFLTATASAFNLNIDYYLFQKKGKILSLGAFYIRNSKIITPEKFSFTALWFSNKLNDVVYLEIAESLIQLLKKKYSDISLKLDPQIRDIRPFLWGNFNVENKYTYLKKDNNPPHYSIIRNISKLPQQYYSFKVSSLEESSLLVNLQFLRVLGFSKSLINSYKILINNWGRIGVIKSFNVYRDEELVCSNIVIVDKNKIYTILLNNAGSKDKYAHTYLYMSIINWSQQKGISEIDFCGANLPSISKFKSYFNSELTRYYIVNYNCFDEYLMKFKSIIFSNIKIIRNKLR